MNFIIRNLGWILLIIFFVFMLYLISNQNNAKDSNLVAGTGVVTEQSELVEEIKVEEQEEIVMVEEVKDEVDEIKKELKKNIINSSIKKLDGNVNKLSQKLEAVSIDVLSSESKILKIDSSTGGIMNSIRNFFTIKKVETKTGSTVTSTGEVTKELIDIVETELKNKKMEVEEDKVKVTKKKSIFDFGFDKKEDVNTGIVGGLNNILGLDDTKEKEKRNAKAMKIETKIVEANKGALATYEIAVKSMFLNNAWFTKRTGVLYKGDMVEQLTNTNKYGCFQVKVLSSSNTANNGKIAWACKYYMIGHQASLSSYKKAANQYYRSMNKTTIKPVTKKVLVSQTKISTKIMSKVGTIYSVKTHSLKLNNKSFTKVNAYLLKGDKVEQLTNTNSSGCFKVSVYSSSNTNGNTQGESGWVCQKYLK